jgi:hypothetical protein
MVYAAAQCRTSSDLTMFFMNRRFTWFLFRALKDYIKVKLNCLPAPPELSARSTHPAGQRRAKFNKN